MKGFSHRFSHSNLLFQFWWYTKLWHKKEHPLLWSNLSSFFFLNVSRNIGQKKILTLEITGCNFTERNVLRMSVDWPWVAVAWTCFYLNLYIYWDCRSDSSAFFCFWLWQTWGQIRKENDLHWPLPTLTWFEQILLLISRLTAAYKSFTGLFDSVLMPLQTMVTDHRQDSYTNPLLSLCFLVIVHTLYIVVARDAQCI